MEKFAGRCLVNKKTIVLCFSLFSLIGCASGYLRLNKLSTEVIENSHRDNELRLIKEFKKTLKNNHVTKFNGSIKINKIYSVKEEKSSNGIEYFFLGKKRPDYRGSFIKKLSSHVKLVTEKTDEHGLLVSYYVFASETFEVALMRWKSEESMSSFFLTKKGKEILDDSASFMETVVWKKL